MALKVLFVIAAVIACAHARPGGPAAYSISAPSVDHASVGSTQEHTVKGHYGQSSQSDYSSAVQTAHSQSHVQRSSISNDAGVAPAIGVSHGLLGHPGIPIAAPALAHYPAPVAVKALAAPALVHTAVAGHGVHYGY
ncbi:cuticle protein 21.3 [Anastrepha obliqua]|uniref:cuticle protein 21.3 n=1 Tax=Anastrepha obliqua TaxID=95512 RepID=UPI00240A4093|nr:cuticle protein 21.3 [Anastrepha obliqua]